MEQKRGSFQAPAFPGLAQLPGALLPWYQQNARVLPWRADRAPYHVWLSEIMLQQTRVEAVRGYYTRFLEALPTIAALAAAEEGLLFKLWEGLGYYSRVRNLQRAAQQIQREYNGVFPREYKAIRSLPGIGDYTAGAVCSICFDMPVAAVDGNVLRVIARLCNIRQPMDPPPMKRAVAAALEAVYPPGQCGDFTQALMELGATLCPPGGRPRCDACPCREFCLGRMAGAPETLPLRTPKRPRKQEGPYPVPAPVGGPHRHKAAAWAGIAGRAVGISQPARPPFHPGGPGPGGSLEPVPCRSPAGLAPHPYFHPLGMGNDRLCDRLRRGRPCFLLGPAPGADRGLCPAHGFPAVFAPIGAIKKWAAYSRPVSFVRSEKGYPALGAGRLPIRRPPACT